MARDRESHEPQGPEKKDEGGFIPDMLRRTVERSVNAILHSDEERRRFVNAILPRDFMNSVMAGVDGTKREAVAMIGREMQHFLQNLNVGEELKKILTSVSFEIATTVRFVPNEDGSLRTEFKQVRKPLVKKGVKAKKPTRKTKKERQNQQTARPAQTPNPEQPRRRGRVRRVVDAIGETAELFVGSRDEEDDEN